MGVQDKQGSEDRGDRDSGGKATGDQIQASGGASVGGNVQAGGDIVGRDKKVVQGDEVGGDKSTAGDISDGAGIALGRGAQAAHADRSTVLQAQGDINIEALQQAGPMRRASKWQIVPPPDTYVRRRALEDRLRELLLSPSEGLHLVLLYGVAGVGTGWLAQQVAVELKEEFPDGMLTADLQATSVADVLWNFVESYDPTVVRGSLHEASRHREHLEGVLGDQKVLLVLDHVESAQQAREVLPTGCPNAVVLLISRTHLPDLVGAANSLHVAEMTADESEELFRRIWKQAGRFRATPSETIRELARRLYFIPASMTAVARDILNRQIAPEDYLEEISSRRRRRDLAIVNAGYEPVYDNLPALGRQLLPFVGVVGGGIWRLDTLVFISQQRRMEVEVGLRQLLAAGLVQREMPGRFQISAAVRDFAVDKLEEIGGKALVAEARALAAQHYCQTCEQVLGHLRRLLLDDFLRDEVRRQRFSQALDQALATFASGDQVGVESSRAQIDPGLGHVDLIQDTFEEVVLDEDDGPAINTTRISLCLEEIRMAISAMCWL